jgi:4-amino-4-deoxy-L-arabinose transferase-like glycosyltransferase
MKRSDKYEGSHRLERSSQPEQAPYIIFWVALIVRIGYMTLAHAYRFKAYEDHFQFGHEMGRIARALATGYGYADPFRGHTGPTAWVAPLYPLIVAGAFKLFGVYTAKAAWAILAFNCVLSALMVRTTWEIAVRCFNVRVARWSAWIWALYPAAMQYATRWVWEMTLTAFLFSWVLVLALRMRGIGSGAGPAYTRRRWALFGLCWGLIALSNPSLLIFLPVCGLWALVGAQDWKREVTGAALAAVVCLACIAPWTYRNWRAFNQFVPLRANFGAELYLGNGPGATGLEMGYDHPFEAPEQLRLYRQMGEVAYSRWRGDEAKAVIRQDPLRVLNLCLLRVYYFWFGVPHPSGNVRWVEYVRSLNFGFISIVGLLGLGLALWRRVPAAVLFGWAFLLLPVVYYMVTTSARFRHPLEPLIAILGVYLFQSAEKRRKTHAVSPENVGRAASR